MAVPKNKQSKSRTNKRFANYKATAPTLVECPHCHSYMQAHRVCASCGYYDKVEVIAQEEKKN
ncbi:MAG: 50S ribosomal protein L32 [Clostridiales bacterium]|nr:50S ribosomal protein L32 [Clostridiales bacterium]